MYYRTEYILISVKFENVKLDDDFEFFPNMEGKKVVLPKHASLVT